MPSNMRTYFIDRKVHVGKKFSKINFGKLVGINFTKGKVQAIHWSILIIDIWMII